MTPFRFTGFRAFVRQVKHKVITTRIPIKPIFPQLIPLAVAGTTALILARSGPAGPSKSQGLPGLMFTREEVVMPGRY
jgi:hypothetical protein